MAKPARPEPKHFLAREHRDGDRTEYERKYFDAESTAKVRGEKSTSYLCSEVAARRIHACYPDAKIVIVLREPVARALSNHRFSTAHGFETLSAWEAFEREDDLNDEKKAAKAACRKAEATLAKEKSAMMKLEDAYAGHARDLDRRRNVGHAHALGDRVNVRAH